MEGGNSIADLRSGPEEEEANLLDFGVTRDGRL